MDLSKDEIHYRLLGIWDLKFYFKLRFGVDNKFREYFVPVIKQFFKYLFVKSIGRYSDNLREFYKIYVFTWRGTRIGFLRINNTHIYKIAASYKDQNRKYLYYASTVPKFRGKGIGTQMWRINSQILFPQSKIFAIISDNNMPAIKIQERLGWTIYMKLHIFKLVANTVRSSWKSTLPKSIDIVRYNSDCTQALYDLYIQNTPMRISKIESVSPQDFHISYFDRLLGKVSFMNYSEYGLMVMDNGELKIYIAITIFYPSKFAHLRLTGSIGDIGILEAIFANVINSDLLKTVDSVDLSVAEYQHDCLALMTSKQCNLHKTYLCTVDKPKLILSRV